MLKQLMTFGIAVVGAGMFSVQPVFAATTTDSPNLKSAATTKASIDLTAGDLKIVQAPDIDFGQQQIDATDKTYRATSVKPNLQVLNAGHDQDWTVSLQVGDFVSSKGRPLKGGSLNFVQIDGDDVNSEIGRAHV